MTGKTAACYSCAFFIMKNDLGGDFDPFCVGIDFERNFVNMVKFHWPDAKLVGCYFHTKQAWRRKLTKLKFPEKLISMMMKRGMLDLATVLPAADVRSINGKGWLFIAQLIDITPTGDDEADAWKLSFEGKTAFALFWTYVSDFWLQEEIFAIWSWADHLEMAPEDRPLFRASCYIESYNKLWNDLHGVHPRLQPFVDTLIQEQQRILTRVENLRKKRHERTIYADLDFPKIPHEYGTFEAPSLKKMNLTTLPKKGNLKRKR